MAATISLYNHTAKLFADGSNSATDTYKVKLFTAATFDAAHTTETAAGGTEVTNANGYTTGGATLLGVTVSTVTTNDAMFDANDVTWSATGSGISANYARVLNSTDGTPLAFIDFGGAQTANAGNDFKIVWSASGIFSFTVA